MSTTKYRVISCDIINLRAKPGPNEKIQAKVEHGHILDVVDGSLTDVDGTKWVQVVLSDAKLWCLKKYLINWSRAYRIVRAAITYSDFMMTNRWKYQQDGIVPEKTWIEATRKNQTSNASFFVSWVAQYAGVIKPGSLITCTNFSTRPQSSLQAISGRENIINGRVIFPVSKTIKEYRDSLEYGDILVYTDSMAIYIGEDKLSGESTIITAHYDTTLNSENEYIRMKQFYGPQFEKKILAVIRPLG